MAVSKPVLRGVRYAFGRGMDPRKKDGVRAHPGVFVAGMLLHVGVGAAAASAILALTGTIPAPSLRYVLVALNAAGAAAGLLLLGRRLREPVLRPISTADDYISTLLVVSVLAAAAWFLLLPGLEAAFLFLTAGLVAYAPFGKIRHCVLFFITRARFGAFIGTRGVLVDRQRR